MDGQQSNRSGVAALIFDTVPSMLAYWDRSLICQYANTAYENWFGRYGSSLVGIAI